MPATTRASVYADDLIRLPFEPHFSIHARVIRSVHYPTAKLCDDIEFVAGPRTHHFAAVIDRNDAGDRFPEADWKALEAYVRPAFREHYDRGHFIAALLDVIEFPARTRWAISSSWWEWLDQYNGEFAEVGADADRIVAHLEEGYDEKSLALLDGCLWYLEHLGIHPNFSGQFLGARLLGHGLASLIRSDKDMAILLASPSTTPFDAPEVQDNPPTFTAEDYVRLARYYGRLGFKRTYPRKRIDGESPVSMFAVVGQPRALNFEGMEPLGKNRRDWL